MGMFDKLLGRGVDHPPLGDSHPVTAKLQEHQTPLQSLAKDLSDPLELVPAERAIYVFIGKPPKKFGLAKIVGGEVKSLQALLNERKLGVDSIHAVMQSLQSAYEQSQSVERYSTTIANRAVVVTPSAELGRKVDEIMRTAA